MQCNVLLFGPPCISYGTVTDDAIFSENVKGEGHEVALKLDTHNRI